MDEITTRLLQNEPVQYVLGEADFYGYKFKVNEYYNKHFNTIGVGKENGHQELMWQLLCMSGAWGKIKFHPYIGFKKKNANNNKAIKLLERIHPNMKQLEVEMLAGMYTTKELKQLAEDHNIESKL